MQVNCIYVNKRNNESVLNANVSWIYTLKLSKVEGMLLVGENNSNSASYYM